MTENPTHEAGSCADSHEVGPCADWDEDRIKKEWKQWGTVEREIYKESREISLELGADRLTAARVASWRVLFNRRFMGLAPEVMRQVESGDLTYGQSRINIGGRCVLVDARFKHAAALVSSRDSSRRR